MQRKKRKKQTKWIQQQMKNWPELRNLLAELETCYEAGAHQAVHLLADQLVKRYLEHVFLLEEETFKQYLIKKEVDNSTTEVDQQCNLIEVHLLRNERSHAFEKLKCGESFIETWQNEQQHPVSEKQVTNMLKQVEQLLA